MVIKEVKLHVLSIKKLLPHVKTIFVIKVAGERTIPADITAFTNTDFRYRDVWVLHWAITTSRQVGNRIHWRSMIGATTAWSIGTPARYLRSFVYHQQKALLNNDWVFCISPNERHLSRFPWGLRQSDCRRKRKSQDTRKSYPGRNLNAVAFDWAAVLLAKRLKTPLYSRMGAGKMRRKIKATMTMTALEFSR